MRYLYNFVGTAVILLASTLSAHADAKYAAKAFADICLTTAPTFKNAPTQAAKYGGTKFMSLGALNIASNSAKNISIQYEPGKECTVTTSKDNSAGKLFLKAVQSKFAVEKIPARVQLGKKIFLIAHNRKGGEAFVITTK